MKKNMARAVVFLAVAIIFARCGRQEAFQKPLTPVRVQAVERSSAGGTVRYSGNIKPAVQVNLAFRLGGYIQDILQVPGAGGQPRDVQEGDSVVKGQVLAHLREADFLAKVNQAKSQLAAAQANAEAANSQLTEAQAGLEYAKLEFDRANRLFSTQSITKADYDGGKAKFDAAQAKGEAAKSQLQASHEMVKGAKAQLEEAELALQDSALKAPFDGLLLKRMVEVGALVGPGVPVFVLANTRSVKVEFGVADLVVQTLRIGNWLSMTTEAVPDAAFRGQITGISPSADPKSRVFEVEVTVLNPRNQLKAGMIASLQVTKEKASESVMVVPLNSIVRPKENLEGYAVCVIEKQGNRQVARFRRVRLGETFGNRIAVEEGLKVGEQVVVSGPSLLVDGEQVQVIR